MEAVFEVVETSDTLRKKIIARKRKGDAYPEIAM
jgi:hypothetical protein